MKPENKTILGITGGTGVGKTLAINFFQKKNFAIIDADKIGHEILKKKKIKDQLLSTFGKKIFKNGKIQRTELGKIVFNHKPFLEKLNQVVHPALKDEIYKKIKK